MKLESGQNKSFPHYPLVHQTFTKSAPKNQDFTNSLPNNITHGTFKALQSYLKYTKDLRPTFQALFKPTHLKMSSNLKDNWQ